ncbi:MAG: pentapeptide repeat-containing protein [Ruminococcus sp.]|nr:pentapeptide repeat-containing protein [Ruminococcus sp.]
MNKKEFEMMNQKLIDGYIDRQKNHAHMLDDDAYPDAKKHRIGWSHEWVGRDMYESFYRRDIMEYAKSDIRMTKVGKFNLINFTLIDLKFERMIAEHCSIMNGTFKNVEFFRFCIKGKPLSESFEASQNIPFKENEYHEYRNIVMNCKFVDCTFMNSYLEHTDWINCEFINCNFINSNLSCEGSQQQNCKFKDCNTMYFKA